MSSTHPRFTRAPILGIVTAIALIGGAASASAQTGGTVIAGTPAPTSGTPGLATLAADGSAIAPPDAPPAVRRAINAANRIRTLPYKWGGGHRRRFRDTGYDCSGAVSFVLHKARMLKVPMASGSLGRWGVPGRGEWITVYANRGHAFAVIAGLRWDTSAVGESLNRGSGPRWRQTQRPGRGYRQRHFVGY